MRRGRLRILVVVGVAAIGAALAYYQFFLRRPVGDGPVGIAVSRSGFERPWTERPVLLIGLGDSVTAGYGASAGKSYFERLVANPGDEFPEMKGICLGAVLPHLTVRNLAVSGSTSIDWLEHQAPELRPAGKETLGIVVMTTGGNDLIHMYGRIPPREGAMYGATLAQAGPWIANFEVRLNAILDRVEAVFPGGCQVFLGTIYDPSDGVGDAPSVFLPAWPDGVAILAEYNRVILECASRRPNVYVVDVHAAFLGHGVDCTQFWRPHYRREDPHYWYFENIEDPNERGYDTLRRLFLNAMAEVFP